MQIYTLFTDLTDVDKIDQSKKCSRLIQFPMTAPK